METVASVCRYASLEIIRKQKMKYYRYYKSPVGMVLLTSENSSLTGLHFVKGNSLPVPPVSIRDEDTDPFPEVIAQLEAYFQGERTEFDIALRLRGTEFEVRAWQALNSIPYGETISYKEQAQRIGSVPRAVGLANGRNPVAIIVPCHRVIGADGKLVGYGGGVERKRALLEFEATVRDFGPQPMRS
jgi:methylated-DNA-[protein]-cysteine S-methyltransferase